MVWVLGLYEGYVGACFYVNRGFFSEHLIFLFNLDFGLQVFLDVWMGPFEFLRVCEGVEIMFIGDI
ncbi:hypothetical protein Hanom_Chr08g00754371 [Helianthus anomalus]